MDVEAWLRGLGLERYGQAFRDNEIDEKVLSSELRNQNDTRIKKLVVSHRSRNSPKPRYQIHANFGIGTLGHVVNRSGAVIHGAHDHSDVVIPTKVGIYFGHRYRLSPV
jgi:hypothetical protein